MGWCFWDSEGIHFTYLSQNLQRVHTSDLLLPFWLCVKNCLNWILRFLKRCGHDGFRVDRTHSWYLKWNEMMNVIDVLLPVMLSRPKLLSSWWRLLEQILITIGAHTGWWGQFSRLLLARHPLRTTKQYKGKNRLKQFLQYCSWPKLWDGLPNFQDDIFMENNFTYPSISQNKQEAQIKRVGEHKILHEIEFWLHLKVRVGNSN